MLATLIIEEPTSSSVALLCPNCNWCVDALAVLVESWEKLGVPYDAKQRQHYAHCTRCQTNAFYPEIRTVNVQIRKLLKTR